MKIHIIGCSGSGKTYLAKALSEKYNIPLFDLDDIYWDNCATAYNSKMPTEKRTELLDGFLQNDDWIIEGVYYAWVGQCFEDADIIYVLDIPKRIYIYRIIKRAIRRKLGFEKGKRETWKSVYYLIKWTDTFQSENMVQIRKILAQYKEKTIWLKRPNEVRKVIREGI
ncbi:MAG: AAA family ATPase [Clostridia bacterium]|nr:AAA family ATPase [Clostridia bacterium]